MTALEITFTSVVGSTPLIIGGFMACRLRQPMPVIGRLAVWSLYLVWVGLWWYWWDNLTSSGSGRYAVEDLISRLVAWGTAIFGAILMLAAESNRLAVRRSS